MTYWMWWTTWIYAIGFVAVFAFNMAIGPITSGLCLFRAIVWPWYVLTGYPHGTPMMMD